MEALVTFLLTGSLIQGVFCGYNINLPKKVEVLKGSCVFIPCTFDIDQQLKNYLTDSAKRKWFKVGRSTAVFDSSSPNTGLLKGEIFGTATQKNCTTRFDNVDQSHEGSYYFRLEANGELQYSYSATHSRVQITVLGSPPRPTLSIFPDQQETTEGSSVSLRCSTKIFCPSRPPSLTWSSSLIESITGQQYYSYKYSKYLKSLVLHNAPKNTSVRINPAGLVLEGRSVTLIRSSDATPVVHYTWYRDSERPLNPVQTGSNLTINNTDPTHSGRYYCTAENTHGTQNSSVLLDVQYAPRNTSLSAFTSSSVMEGDPVTLICSSDANPAELNYTWYTETGSQFELLQTGHNHTYIVTNPTYGARYGCKVAPKISSSCSRSSVMACVCEAHGNPCPTLEWRLSGYVLANSTETSISEETLGSTGVKSVLNIHQSLTDTDVLQCFSTKNHGSCSQQFQAAPPPQDTRFHHPSVLLGAAVGASVMMIVCIVMLCYERRRKEKPSEPRQDDRSGLILTQTAVSLDNDSEFVYANKGMRSSTAPSAPESLHYSSIDFTNADPPSAEIRGIASLTSEYAAVRQRPAGAADAENNTSTSETEPKKPDMTAKIPDTSSPASEDVIYENI
ncbi:Schwann cell myelin protein-like [Sinocyclocheilus grahami]|uniref:Schwann cell myelin protein-like n=1 Tax=Sinocyclocheilus grahami TaxID=75366 RepID=UPI0007AD4873|nr:PREDICTED: Schwann cell myelin protein-like [Sinocyclocheilus grahami]